MGEGVAREGRAWRVRGRVQGVGFRWWAMSVANRIGVTGSVRNASDGAVLVVAWGDGPQLDELERQLRRGPLAARVDALEELSVPAPPAPESFSIER